MSKRTKNSVIALRQLKRIEGAKLRLVFVKLLIKVRNNAKYFV
jgi:hypothetical protein